MIRSPCAYFLASRAFSAGTRKASTPASRAPIVFCLMPPIGPTRPSRKISPVAAILWPRSTFRPSSSRTSSANASPADGPPTPPASIETGSGAGSLGLVEQDPDDAAFRAVARRDGLERDRRGAAARVTVKRTECADRLPRHHVSRRPAECARGCRRPRRSRPSAGGFPAAGSPGSTETTAPRRPSGTFLPSARRATAAATCCEGRISVRSSWRCCALVHARAGRPRRGRVEVGAVVEAAEQPLEQRRLADDHVDEVDPAAVVRLVAARDLDERRDRVRLVGQEDVLVRRDHPERERRRRAGPGRARKQPARVTTASGDAAATRRPA